MTRRRKSTVQALPDHVRRSETWHGLRPGDAVAIAGVAGRGHSWVFRAHVRNERNGAESVEVSGGRPGEHHVRSFHPDQVFPLRSRRGAAGPSLAQAPQLPFG